MTREAKNIVISIGGKAVTLEMDVKDEDMIEAVLGSLAGFVKNGSLLKVYQAYGKSISSSSVTRLTGIISSTEQMQYWKDDLRRVVRIQKGRM